MYETWLVWLEKSEYKDNNLVQYIMILVLYDDLINYAVKVWSKCNIILDSHNCT